MIAHPKRTNWRTWDQIMREEMTDNPFTAYAELLVELNTTPDEAASRMLENYEKAVTNYTSEAILEIFVLNLMVNKSKYNDLVNLYNWDFNPFVDKWYNESYASQRTPNLTSTSESSGSGSVNTERKQTRTTTNNPGAITVTQHEIQPYDASGLRIESKDTSTDSGSSTTTETYSGQPDHSETSSEAQSTMTTTGFDQNEYTKKYIGRTGNLPTSEVVADGMKAAAMHDVLDQIIKDIAEQIFIQAWII